MKITFLGVGGFFSTENYHSNLLLEDDNGDALLIDSGQDLRFALKAADKDPAKIKAVYISHLHGDHASLEWLAFYSFFVTKKKPTLYIHPSLVSELRAMLAPSIGKTECGIKQLEDYFDLGAMTPEGRDYSFNFGEAKLDTVMSSHVVHSPTKAYATMYSYGLMISTDLRSVYFTGDTNSTIENPKRFWCYVDADVVFQEVSTFKSGVHCYYDDLDKKFATEELKEIKPKLWLYHYGDGPKPDAVADGFAGWVKQGQVFEF